MPETYCNGQNKLPGGSGSQRGTAHAPRGDKEGCRCLLLLKSFVGHIDAAKRTAREVIQADAAAGDRFNSVQSVYNYARLGPVVIELFFDGQGNWAVHEACARRYQGVSNWWLARCQSRAIDGAQILTVKMTKSAIASSTNPDALISHIRRPDDYLLFSVQCYKSCNLTTAFNVTSSVEHGLTGLPFNRAKVAEQRRFVAFLKSHLSPKGHSADRHGRYHGAALYLDSRWVVLRAARGNTNDNRLSFSAAFNSALAAAGMQKVHANVPLRWLRVLFGSTKRINGCYVPSDEQATLYPRKTDACSSCELFLSDLGTATQTPKRHRQQDDEGSLQLREAISQVKLTISHLEDARHPWRRG